MGKCGKLHAVQNNAAGCKYESKMQESSAASWKAAILVLLG